MQDKVSAPFTDEQVSLLEIYQTHPNFHPYTCGYDGNHILEATNQGWICPHDDYKQDYALASSLNVANYFKDSALYFGDKKRD